ncbi:hypothetical protein ACF3NS_14650 [Arsenicicoccus cauae]|uniref:hypothetical protein n=1 Tax=Arsenicicoccus cauae TaxID=2663847 RepID=UPI002596A112|nr:hypothetical protein [Arsenicicoccus cauae]
MASERAVEEFSLEPLARIDGAAAAGLAPRVMGYGAAHVNPHGGAIALGHPLGISGARLALTAAISLADGGHDHALATMCVGVGQGVAMLLSRP